MEETSVQSAVVLLERRISRGDALAAGARTSARYLEVSIADTEVALDERCVMCAVAPAASDRPSVPPQPVNDLRAHTTLTLRAARRPPAP